MSLDEWERRKEIYAQKMKDPRWQRRRLEIMARDDFSCRFCYDNTKTLHVHHKYYENDKDPWDYPDEALITLCLDCHQQEGKPYRGRVEESLLHALRLRSFSSDHVLELARAVYMGAEAHQPDVATIAYVIEEMPVKVSVMCDYKPNVFTLSRNGELIGHVAWIHGECPVASGAKQSGFQIKLDHVRSKALRKSLDRDLIARVTTGREG